MEYEVLRQTMTNSRDEPPTLWLGLCLMEAVLEDMDGSDPAACPLGDERAGNKMIHLSRFLLDAQKAHDGELKRNRKRLDDILAQVSALREALEAEAGLDERVRALEQEKQTLEAQGRQAEQNRSRCDALEHDCAALRARLADLRGVELPRAEAARDALLGEEAELRRAVDALTGQCAEGREQNARLRRENESLARQLQQAQSERQAQEAEQARYQRDLPALRRQSDALRASLQSAKQEAEQLQTDRAALAEELAREQTRLTEARAECERQAQALRAETAELEGQQTAAQAALSELTARRDALQSQTDALERERGELSDTLNRMESSVPALEETLAGLRESISAAEAEHARLLSEQSQLRMDADDLRESNDLLVEQSRAPAEEQLRQEQSRKAALEREIAALNARRDTTAQEKRALQAQKTQLEQENAYGERLLERDRAACARERERADLLSHRREELEREAAEVTRRLNAAQMRVSELEEDTLPRLRRDAQAQEELSDALSKRQNELEQQISAAEGHIDRRRESVRAQEERRRALNAEYETLTKRTEENDAELSALNRQLTELRAKAAPERLDTLRRQRSEQIQAQQDLEQTCAALEGELSQLRAGIQQQQAEEARLTADRESLNRTAAEVRERLRSLRDVDAPEHRQRLSDLRARADCLRAQEAELSAALDQMTAILGTSPVQPGKDCTEQVERTLREAGQALSALENALRGCGEAVRLEER